MKKMLFLVSIFLLSFGCAYAQTPTTQVSNANPFPFTAGGIPGHLNLNQAFHQKVDTSGGVVSLLSGTTSALQFAPAGVMETLESHALHVFDVKDAGATGDSVTYDTAVINNIIAQVNTQLAKFHSAALYFPAGDYRVGKLNPINVPQGVAFSLYGAHGGTRILSSDTTGSDIIQVAETKPTGAPGGFSTIAVSDMFISYNGTVQGGSAVHILGMPITSGGGGFRVRTDNIDCINTASYGLTNCVNWSDVSLSSANHIHFYGASSDIGNGDPAQGTAFYLNTTADPATTNYSNDNTANDITIQNGFAGVRMQNHIEGLHLTNISAVGSAYMLYGPAWAEVGGGPSWLTVAHSHGNVSIAGIYVENGGDLYFTDNLIFNGVGKFPTYSSNALLPYNWTQFLSGHNYAWAGIWCTNCQAYHFDGNKFFGFQNAGQPSTGVNLDIAAIGGLVLTSNRTDIGDVSHNNISSMASGCMQSNNAYTNLIIDGTVCENTTVPLTTFLSTGAVLSGNTQDGVPLEIGYSNGGIRINAHVVSDAVFDANVQIQNLNMLSGKSISFGVGTNSSGSANTPASLYGNGDGILHVTGLGLNADGTINVGNSLNMLSNKSIALGSGGTSPNFLAADGNGNATGTKNWSFELLKASTSLQMPVSTPTVGSTGCAAGQVVMDNSHIYGCPAGTWVVFATAQ